MFRTIFKASLLLIALVVLPLTKAHAADGFTLPTRDDDVEPVPEAPYYAGWGYVCDISRREPGIVTASLQTSASCAGYTQVVVVLCDESNLGEYWCPVAEEADHPRSLYSDSEMSLTAGLLREAMVQRYSVRVYRNEYYGYLDKFTGQNVGIQYGHRAIVQFD